MFAVALAIGPSGVEEVHAQVHSLLKGSHRFVIIGAGPASHPPHPVADFTHFPASTPKCPTPHGVLPEPSLSAQCDRRRHHSERCTLHHSCNSPPAKPSLATWVSEPPNKPGIFLEGGDRCVWISRACARHALQRPSGLWGPPHVASALPFARWYPGRCGVDGDGCCPRRGHGDPAHRRLDRKSV